MRPPKDTRSEARRILDEAMTGMWEIEAYANDTWNDLHCDKLRCARNVVMPQGSPEEVEAVMRFREAVGKIRKILDEVSDLTTCRIGGGKP